MLIGMYSCIPENSVRADFAILDEKSAPTLAGGHSRGRRSAPAPASGSPPRRGPRVAHAHASRDRPANIGGKAATQTATLRDNPVEHGNIGVIKSGGQARHRATGLRYHDLECAITAEMLSMMGGVTAEDPL